MPRDATEWFDRCRALLLEGDPDPDECSWRMVAMINWWVRQMHEATDGDIGTVMRVITHALNDAGIATMTVAVPSEARPH